MRIRWSWKEGFRFALARALLSKEGLSYKMSPAEKIGSLFLKPLYRVIEFVSKHIRRPLAIILFTIAASLLAFVVFYNIPALVILGKIFPSKMARFVFFLYAEANLLAMGFCAFGRFNNSALVALWKNGKLEPVFPGDKR
jgi:hypothetical protein